MLENLEDIRRGLPTALDDQTRSRLGQFFTPQPIARFMASLFVNKGIDDVSVLDAGAGIGSLSMAFLENFLTWNKKNAHITAYEIDGNLLPVLQDGLNSLKNRFFEHGGDLDIEIVNKDFVECAVIDLCMNTNRRFDYAILNPPYCKINSDSVHRRLLRKAGIETVNLYSAFVGLVLKLLLPAGRWLPLFREVFATALIIGRSGKFSFHLLQSTTFTCSMPETRLSAKTAYCKRISFCI